MDDRCAAAADNAAGVGIAAADVDAPVRAASRSIVALPSNSMPRTVALPALTGVAIHA